jgi:hypothetical protein
MILDFIKNNTLYRNKYRTHSEAAIVTCFFNPTNNPYRTKAFNIFYESIKHLNHMVIECVIGDAKPELPENDNIKRVHTQTLLWHKETLLNLAIKSLPSKYKYIFWVDADVLFTNKNWLVESVEKLKKVNILQPFEYCFHLEKDELEPSFNIERAKLSTDSIMTINRHPMTWRSFASNAEESPTRASSENYDYHGHVGFAWGAKRSILEACPLYDRALIGGADHIMAHAAAGHIPHNCITKSFTDDIQSVNDWSRDFYAQVKGLIGYTKGDLYHIWHGDLKDRQYLKRIQEFTGTSKTIVNRDENGLFKSNNDEYVRQYFDKREYRETPVTDTSFTDSVIAGFVTNDPILGGIMGGNMIGGMIGAELRPDETPIDNAVETYTPEVIVPDSVDTSFDDNSFSDNFS